MFLILKIRINFGVNIYTTHNIVFCLFVFLNLYCSNQNIEEVQGGSKCIEIEDLNFKTCTQLNNFNLKIKKKKKSNKVGTDLKKKIKPVLILSDQLVLVENRIVQVKHLLYSSDVLAPCKFFFCFKHSQLGL